MGLFGLGKKQKQEAVQGKLEALLDGHEIPSFQAVTMRILREVRDPETSTDRLAEVLQWDPGLVVRVLKTVNTASYSPAKPIQCVAHAASFMGRAALEQLVLAIAIKDAVPSTPAPGFEPRTYWRAACFRAGLSRQLAARLHPAKQAECFTSGLLQDLAVPVLANARQSDYGPVLEHWHGEPSAHLDELERDALGWTHSDVGALLGHMWELPENLVQSIQHHHSSTPSDSELPPAVKLVSVLRESETQLAEEALIERARLDYGLESDWTLETLRAAEDQSRELADMLS